MAVRGELTDELKARGAQEGKEYAILTAEMKRGKAGIVFALAGVEQPTDEGGAGAVLSQKRAGV